MDLTKSSRAGIAAFTEAIGQSCVQFEEELTVPAADSGIPEREKDAAAVTDTASGN